MTKRNPVTSCTLNEGREDQFTLWSYEFSFIRAGIFYILSTLTLGVPFVLAHWRPDWAISWKRRRCPFDRADTVFVKDASNQLSSEEVRTVNLDSQEVSEEYIDHAVRVGILPSKSTIISDGEDSETPSSNSSEHSSAVATDRTRLLVDDGDCQLTFRYFEHKHTRYIWDSATERFSPVFGLAEQNVKISLFTDISVGLSSEEQAFRLQLFGRNSVDVQIQSYMSLLVSEVLNPFYIFQVGSIILWSLDSYLFYATCIFLISTFSIGISLYETRKQSVALHEMVSASNVATVQVLRNDGSVEEISSELVVPGDVIVIPPHGCVMTCDAALIRGTCIVNESMLTGESVPVTKSAVTLSEDEEMYSAEGHKRHTLFSGTHVIQTRFYGHDKVLAVVVRTGFETSKGELVRSILYPKPMKGFKFYADAMKFVLLLFCFAAGGMAYVVYLYIVRGADISRILLRSLDVITVVVPPALPAAMTVGTVYAQNRLKKQNVFCISPPRINVCGKLKLFCFDKTGTLTEEGLDLWGVVPVDDAQDFAEPIHHPCPPFMPVDGHMMVALASCHTLTMVDGALTGDPLDVKMFEATQWELEEPDTVSEESRFDLLVPCIVRPPNPSGFRRSELSAMGRASLLPKSPSDHKPAPTSTLDPAPKVLKETSADSEGVDQLIPSVVAPPDVGSGNSGDDEELMDIELPYEVGIVRQFPFTSSLQRMSVVTRTLGEPHMNFYCKGAPEKILGLCEPTTLPSNYQKRLEEYTALGFRVIALAYKELSRKVTWHHCMRAKRDTYEIDLKFLGFLILRNTLKPQTTPVITELREARIKSVMVTGDNLHTAICVARECGMVTPGEHVVIVNAGVPGEGSLSQPPWIAFELADLPPIPTTTADGNCFDAFQRSQSVVADMEAERLLRLKPDEPIAFAMNGKVWNILRNHFPYLVAPILMNAKIFGRMTPDQKAQLVETFQELGFIVGMCGDGANDCGALKAAHVGISLSEAEASVAAPFTSKVSDIRCVPTAIREGRCALVTSFGAFKYMSLYSLVQFFSVLILYTRKTNLGDTQYLYIDLFITGTVAVLMGYSQAYPKLHKKRPPGSLVSPRIVASLVVHSLLALGAQLAAFYVLITRPWYVPVNPGEEDEIIQCWETTVVFCVSSFQYLVLAAVFSRGPPFRKPLYTNYLFLLALLLLGAFNTLLLIYPVEPLASFFELETNEGSPLNLLQFRLMILAVPLAHSVIAFLVENQAMERKWFRRATRTVIPKKTPKNRYKLLERRLELMGERWPPVVGKKLYPGDEDLTCFGSLDNFITLPS